MVIVQYLLNVKIKGYYHLVKMFKISGSKYIDKLDT